MKKKDFLNLPIGTVLYARLKNSILFKPTKNTIYELIIRGCDINGTKYCIITSHDVRRCYFSDFAMVSLSKNEIVEYTINMLEREIAKRNKRHSEYITLLENKINHLLII